MDDVKQQSGRVRWYELAYGLVLAGLIIFAVFELKPDKIGVLDLDRALRDLELEEVVGGERQAIQEAAAKELELLRGQYGEQRTILTDRLTAEQIADTERAELTSRLRTLDLSMKSEANTILTESRRAQLDLLAGYRVRLQPMIDAVAREERLDVVLTRGAHTLYMHKSVDITDTLVGYARPRVSDLRSENASDPEN